MIRTNASINVARFLIAMEAKHYTLVAAAANCGVSTRTLARVLRGEWPERLDAFWRVARGLDIPIEEAIINARPFKTKGLHLVSNRWSDKEIA